jgi:YbaB/EbfC DNA-binding family
MTDLFDYKIEDLMREFRERRAKAGDLQRQITELRASATTPRQTVKVTVDVHGAITALEFPTGAYKRMTPTELAEAITSTAAEAKTKVLDSLHTVVLPELPAGLNYVDLIQGKADFATALPQEPSMPDAVRDYAETGRVPERAGVSGQ